MVWHVLLLCLGVISGFQPGGENTLVEFLTVFFFFVAAYWQYRCYRKGNFRFFSLLFLILFIFAGLEELSYGQHIFEYGIDTSDYNAQNETNLHNIRIGSSSELLHFLEFGVLLFSFSLIVSFVPWFRRLYRRFDYPGNQPFLGGILGILVILLMVSPDLLWGIRMTEVLELLIAFLFYRYSLYLWKMSY
ncbi:MAG: hypothetical protein R6V53_05295 [Candidatus Woesearchaeota archaeon]